MTLVAGSVTGDLPKALRHALALNAVNQQSNAEAEDNEVEVLVTSDEETEEEETPEEEQQQSSVSQQMIEKARKRLSHKMEHFQPVLSHRLGRTASREQAVTALYKLLVFATGKGSEVPPLEGQSESVVNAWQALLLYRLCGMPLLRPEPSGHCSLT